MTNVLVFLTDDHAQWAAGCYGNAEIRTPTLDHLARRGVQMLNAFTPTPVCSPARASFWTGEMASRHGVHDFLAQADPEVTAIDWMAGCPTLADRFHAGGYQTGLVGKWHLGSAECPPPSFDYWYGLDMPVARPLHVRSPWPTEPQPPGGYHRHAVADRAVEFLRRRTAERPFFLFVGLFATHSPWTGHSARLVEQYRRGGFADIPQDVTYPFGRLAGESLYASRNDPVEALAQYYAAVSEIDEQVGRILDELEAQELTSETLVVYTSDHGLNTGHHGIWGKGNGTRPYNMTEESIRIPMILSQPGVILPGQRRAEPVTHCDLHRTLLDHAGVPDPPEPSGPGRSFTPMLTGRSIPDWPDRVFGEYGDLRMVRTARYKLIRRYPSGPDELFDLCTDPRESRDILGDPAIADTVGDLSDSLEAFFARHGDPERSGLRVRDLPRHNAVEAWRDSGPRGIVETPGWLAAARRAQGS